VLLFGPGCFNFGRLQEAVDDGGNVGNAPEGGDGSSTGDFCGAFPSPIFCEDFDQRAFPGQWDVQSDIGGSYGVDPSEFVSPPNSLLVKYAPSGVLNTWLRKAFPRQVQPTQVDLDFEFKPLMGDPAAGAVSVVASIDFYDRMHPDTNRYTLQFTLENTLNIRLDEQGLLPSGNLYVSHEPTIALSPGGWTDVHLTVTSSGGVIAGAHVTFNGATAIETTLRPTVDANATDVQLTVGGVFVTPATSAWQMAFDNVTLDVRP